MKSLRAAFSLFLTNDTTITIFHYHAKHLADYLIVVVVVDDAHLYPDSVGSLLLCQFLLDHCTTIDDLHSFLPLPKGSSWATSSSINVKLIPRHQTSLCSFPLRHRLRGYILGNASQIRELSTVLGPHVEGGYVILFGWGGLECWSR